jgi:hypothetical protein
VVGGVGSQGKQKELKVGAVNDQKEEKKQGNY